MIRFAPARKSSLIALLLVVWFAASALAQVPISDFEQALGAIPVSDVSRFVAAVELGMSQSDFPAVEVLQFIGRLASTAYSAAEKEAVLVHVFVAMEEGLPVDGLVTKGLEGIARGVPLQQIEQSLRQRLTLLVETRDLLYAKGIFSVAPGSPQSVPTAVPTPRFNLLVTHISDTIADYLEGGGSPFEGQTVYQEVRFRLTSLEGATLNPADVDLVLKRLEPADMTRVALSAVT
jgi:hypothetical protein